MDRKTRQALIEQYRSGADEVAAALEGMDDRVLDRRPSPDAWTAREIVHHLADSEMTSAIRLRRLIAEDHPAIMGYDEAEFARRLYYDRPLGASLQVLAAARTATAEILDLLTEEEWQREGTHSDSGRYSVEDWLVIYAAHAHDHAAQIRRARTGQI